MEVLIILTKPKQAVFDPSKLYVIQDIHVSDEQKLRLNERVNRAELQVLVKGENDSPGVYSYWHGKLETVRDSENRLEFIASFNSRLRSWDYDWSSNRWRGEKLHVVQIYVLYEVEPGILEVIGTVVGPDFQITSNKTQSMRNKMDRAAQEAAAAAAVAGLSGDSTPVLVSPAKKVKLSPSATTTESSAAASMRSLATSPYIEYLNAATACLRGHAGVPASLGGDSMFPSAAALTAASSSASFSLMGASPPQIKAVSNPVTLPHSDQMALAQAKIMRETMNQAKVVRETMTLEDVSHVLMSLKASGSGQIYSSANLINPPAYMYDVNKLIELQRPSSASSSSSAPASQMHDGGEVESKAPVVETSDIGTNTDFVKSSSNVAAALSTES